MEKRNKRQNRRNRAMRISLLDSLAGIIENKNFLDDELQEDYVERMAA